jgi:two-component system response regulator PhoP
MRILLVEDEAPLRETLAARLKREGYAVDAAQADGEEGLYMGREVPFDVGIIDLGLPKMSGMELIKALRDEGKKFPVLILTARSSWQDKVDGLKQGATTTWSSPSMSRNCWPASMRSCAALLAGASRPWNAGR